MPFILEISAEEKPEKPKVTPKTKVIQLGSLPATKAKRGDHKVIMQVFKIKVPEGGAYLHTLSFKAMGAGNEARDVKRVTLYHDVNKNKVIDATDTVLARSKFAQDNGAISLSLSKPTFFDKGNLQLMVGYDFK
jgi:hypothetical protein